MLGGDSALINSAQARQLRWLALDQEAELRIGGALVLLEQAIARDPAYFPAYHEYLRLMYEQGADEQLERKFARPQLRGGATARCVSIVVRTATYYPVLTEAGTQALRASVRGRAADSCTAFFLASDHLAGEQLVTAAARHIPYAEMVTRLEPDVGFGWIALVNALKTTSRYQKLQAVAKAAHMRNLHSLERIELGVELANAALAAGDSAAGRDGLARLRSAAARDARPGILYRSPPVDMRDPVVGQKKKLELATAHGAWARAVDALHVLGKYALDRGDPASAVRYHDAEIALVDAHDSPRLRLIAYVQRGRALSKLGRLRDAERNLLTAIALAPRVRDPYYLIEAYHNLAHTYESRGQWYEAARAADFYIASAHGRESTGQRVMSLYDAGVIRWKAGWHAAAQRDFEEMVRAVDAVNAEHYWAGEYFERIGELTRAIPYYRQAVAGISDVSIGLAGLTRVFLALGQEDSAEIAARRHDALQTVWQPLETPLLPGVLARRGRLSDAAALSHSWAAHQRARGNAHGAVIATLELGDLLLRAGDARAALIEAERAAGWAREFHLADELIRSQRIVGAARIQLGSIAAGSRLLEAAARQAYARAAPAAVIATHVDFGDALLAAGKPEAALITYGRGARAVEAVTYRLDTDINRVGYRDQHLAPFDGALRALAAMPPTRGNLERLVHWSMRRKAAALRLAVERRAQTTRPAALPSLAQIQRNLAADELLLDYQIVGTTPAVLAITNRTARLIRLPVTADSLRILLQRVNKQIAPVSGGRVDLHRLRFDYRAAHELWRVLVAPTVAEPARTRRVFVIPDGPLHYLPFEALATALPRRTPGGRTLNASARYLLDAYDVVYLPSLASAAGPAESRTNYHASARLLLVAGSAPGANAEARAVMAAWPASRTTALQNEAATESALRRHRGYNVLHVVAHARADGRDPLASHLRLLADQENDGFFHVSEILETQPLAELVVLSGCETVSGKLYGGDGLLGLARAFMLAGSRSVIATHWPVGETNAELMRGFYGYLRDGDDAASALRRARLRVRQREQTAHPIFWAGTILIAAQAKNL
ncbi:MAG: CHAT domain-containing protein [Gemmatimonadota bacterium]